MNNAPDLVALGLKQAVDTYRKFPHQPQMPSVVYGIKDGEITCFAKLRITDYITKAISHASARQMLKDHDCDASIFVAESWMSPNAAGRPSQCPARQEVVVVDVSTPDYHKAVSYSMKRDEKGAVIDLVERDGGSSESRWDFFAEARGDRTTH